MKKLICIDYDNTLSRLSYDTVYICMLINLCCNDLYEYLLKYLKIIIFIFTGPILFLLSKIINNDKILMNIINRILFWNIKKSQIEDTAKKIKPYLIKYLNNFIIYNNSLIVDDDTLIYVITGNLYDIIKYVCDDLNFNCIGTTLEYKNDICTGKSLYICIEDIKLLKIKEIINKIGQTRDNIHLITYGDNYGDFHMLAYSDELYVVGNNKKLINKLNAIHKKYTQLK
jgi:hypothetical protein